MSAVVNHFVVEFTVERAYDSGKTWRQNLTLDVLCSTAERALEMTRAEHPSAVVHVVRRVGSNNAVLIDTQEPAPLGESVPDNQETQR
jgi:hypothetical protein